MMRKGASRPRENQIISRVGTVGSDPAGEENENG